ncbi:hypothetical protein PtA15_6A29 [Puccinia triticina]|uniref:Uncharacterized protein n=1 Tax=Puccinia triticina TaxID=208348 RepID=A0ABY7CJJ2_9BASI|nr:uncharacterized protein PtA15_6A29 [Puccinia triticina]WAQ85401.1 hypothetical protein PtA15_6A29 [Puccinia triticina]
MHFTRSDSFKLIPPCEQPFTIREQIIQMVKMKSCVIHDRLLRDLIAHGWRLNGRSEETETDWQLDAKLDAQLDADLDAQRAKESDSDSEDLDTQRAEEPKV